MLSFPSYATGRIVLIADPVVLSIRIEENNEPMIDLKEQTIIAFGPSPEVPNNTDYTKMRQTVYAKLVEAQKLLPPGIKFRLYEAHRSIELQEKLFEERYKVVKSEHPTWSHKDLFHETTKLISPVTNLDGSRNVPPHSTGGAIDIYLIDEQGQVLDMGIATADWMKDTDGALSATASTKISAEARKNRSIMNEALDKVGFVNYPTEYWHWSYGDRYWAYYKQEPFALYGSK